MVDESSQYPVEKAISLPLRRDKAGYLVLADNISKKQVDAINQWLKERYHIQPEATLISQEGMQPKLALRLPPSTTEIGIEPLLAELAQQQIASPETINQYKAEEEAYQAQFKGPIGWFRRRLQERALSTIGGVYLTADAMSGVIGVVNSVGMVNPKGLNDLGYTVAAGSSSAAMLAYGSPDNGRTPAANAHQSMMDTLTENSSLSWLVDRSRPVDEVTLKGSFDNFMISNAENIGMVNNAISGMMLAKAGIDQLNPLKFTQGAIITTTVGIPYLVVNFGKQLNSIFGKLPGIAGKAWEYLYEKPRDLIKFTVIHNAIGMGTSMYDAWRSPKERERLLKEHDPDTYPIYRGFHVETGADGLPTMTREGHWKDMSTPELRKMLDIMKAGWIAVDEHGMTSAPTAEQLSLLEKRNAVDTNTVTVKEDGKTIHLVHAGQVPNAEKFEDTLTLYQMYNRLPKSAAINAVMVVTYALANILWSNFKPQNAEPDPQEQLSLAAAELLKPSAGTKEQQTQRQAILLDYMADHLSQQDGFNGMSRQDVAGQILHTAEQLANSAAASLLQPEIVQGGTTIASESQALDAVQQQRVTQVTPSLEPLLAIAREAYGQSLSAGTEGENIAYLAGKELSAGQHNRMNV